MVGWVDGRSGVCGLELGVFAFQRAWVGVEQWLCWHCKVQCFDQEVQANAWAGVMFHMIIFNPLAIIYTMSPQVRPYRIFGLQ